MQLDSALADELLEKVREAYSKAADHPLDSHPFPMGRDFALSLGYPEDLLEGLPESAVARFTGVSNVSVFAEIPPGSTVLDLGCGAGMDSMIAAAKTGPRSGAAEAGAANVDFREAEGQSIPFADGSFDVVLVNGIFNLNPNRAGLFQELARVIRPGGVLYGAEIVLREPMDEEERTGLANWFS